MTAELFELRQEQLHELWDAILERGLIDIRRDMKPNWRIEDVYSALRAQQVNCVLARRAGRILGFLIYSKQLRIFNFLPEMFVWAAWNLPIREWQPDDDMAGTVAAVWNYIANIAKTSYGTNEITWVTRPSRAKAFARKFGWQPAWVTMTAKV